MKKQKKGNKNNNKTKLKQNQNRIKYTDERLIRNINKWITKN